MLLQPVGWNPEVIDHVEHLEFLRDDSFCQHIPHLHFLPGTHQDSAGLGEANLFIDWLTGSDNDFIHAYPPSSQSQLCNVSARSISLAGKLRGLPRASTTTPTLESKTVTQPPSPGIPIPTSLSSAGAR